MGSESRDPTPENATLFQAFEWNVPPDGKHWRRLRTVLPALEEIGIHNLWLPPGCKASSPEGNGYDIYDLWDLGEFDQKGSRATKWGSKEELMQLADKAEELGVGLYWDAVLNHKAAADRKEKCKVVEVDGNDRNKEITEPYEIEAWVGFDFPGRGAKYSAQKYHWYHFSGTDYDAAKDRTAIFRICGENKGWSKSVANEQGNADFMMFADLDYSHQEVIDDAKNWGVWIVKELRLQGFRLDAVQHFSERFSNEWVEHLRSGCGRDLFFVGEYWVSDVKAMLEWLEAMNHGFSLYDAPLVSKFSEISRTERADLRKVFDDTLVQADPVRAVTVVMNHDTQPGQTIETPIEGFFKPLAYALVLLRNKGYPSVFYGDLYGMKGKHPEPPSCGGKLADLVLARKLYAYGDQNDYWNEKNCIGWVRRGTWDRPYGLACVMSNAGPGEIRMAVGEEHKGEVWTDLLAWADREVTIDDEGFGVFPCPGVSMSLYVNREAKGREKFPVNLDADIYGRV